MNIKKTVSIVLAIVYSFFAIGLSGENIGLPDSMTMRSIAILLLIGIFCSVLVYEKKIEFKVYNLFIFLMIGLSIIVMWILLSYLFSPYQELIEMRDIFSWLAIPISILVTSKLLKYLKALPFLKTIVVIQFIALVILYVWIFNNVNDLMQFSAVRTFVNMNITIGLNRFLNGIIFLSVVSIIFVLGYIKVNKNIYFISLLNILFTLFISFSTGSRQSLIGVLFVFFISYFIKQSTKFKVNYKGLFSLLLFAFLLAFLLQNEEVQKWVDDRYISNTSEQLTMEEDLRMNIYSQALNDVKSNILFGTGPGTYYQVSTLGFHTHNGYLYTVNNLGVVPLFILLVIFLTLIIISFRNRRIAMNSINYKLFIFSYSSVLVFVLIMNMFNDLTTNLSFWIAVTILMAIINRTTQYKKKSKIKDGYVD